MIARLGGSTAAGCARELGFRCESSITWKPFGSNEPQQSVGELAHPGVRELIIDLEAHMQAMAAEFDRSR